MKIKYPVFFFFLFFAGTLFSQTLQDTLNEIDKLFNERYKAANPGCQLAISRKGKVIYSKAWGMADLEHNIPLTTNSIIEAGSVSKQFVAASLLLLEQQGKLSMNDDIRNYFPELPDYGKAITLDHMMRHTSGFKDWGSIAELTGWPRGTKAYSNEDVLQIMIRQKTLNHQPGDEYMYSNSNYNLFVLLIEKVSGMSLNEYSKKYIFEPAGMKNTSWRDDFKRIVPERSIAYSKKDSVYFTDMPNEYVYGQGGLLTTAEDLLKWNDYYQGGKFGSPDLLSKITTVFPLNNGAKNNYAAGLFIEERGGYTLIQHSGATAGYRCYLSYFPDIGLSVAWMSNTSEFDGSGHLTNNVEGLFLDPDLEVNSTESVEVDKKTLKKYTGIYKNIRSNYPSVVLVHEGEFKINYISAPAALNDSVFVSGGKQYVFNGDEMTIITGNGDSIKSIRAEEVKINAGYLKEFVGAYYSDETNASFMVDAGSQNLMIRNERNSGMRAEACYKDAFTVESFAGVLVFERDTKGNVVRMIVSIPRARKVVYEKK